MSGILRTQIIASVIREEDGTYTVECEDGFRVKFSGPEAPKPKHFVVVYDSGAWAISEVDPLTQATAGQVDPEPILKTYAHHKPGPGGISRIMQLRQAFSDMHRLITTLAPNSRERSIALTELETSAMWAIKSVVCNDPESVV